MSPPLQMRQPGAHKLDDAQPAPFAGAVIESSPSVAHAGNAARGIAGKIPGNPHGPAQAAMLGKVAVLVNASRRPSAQPIGSMDMTGVQTPAEHVSLLAQRRPQTPQLFTSSPSRTHCVPHNVNPLAQIGLHTPPAQTSVPVQRVPQAPQLFVLLVMSTQVPAHIVVPSGHSHIPARQVAPAAHAFAQRPQCERSEASTASQPFAALPSQLPKPVLHVNPHTPTAHVGVALGGVGHAVLHDPQ